MNDNECKTVKQRGPDHSVLRLQVLQLITKWHVESCSGDGLLNVADAAFEWVKAGNVTKINEGNK